MTSRWSLCPLALALAVVAGLVGAGCGSAAEAVAARSGNIAGGRRP